MIQGNTHVKDLKGIEIEEPDHAGGLWKAIPHTKIVWALRKECESRKWKVNEEIIGLTRDRTSGMAASFEIETDLDVDGFKTCWGIVNHNNRRHKVYMYGGVVEDKDATALVLHRDPKPMSHTYGLQLRDEISVALDYWYVQCYKYEKRIDLLKRMKIDDYSYMKILLDAGRRTYCPWSRLGLVDKYWHNRLDTPQGKTAHTLMQAFGDVVVQNPPMQQMPQMNNFRKLIMKKLRAKASEV